MADTERTLAELLASFASGQPIGAIDSQDMRDYVVSADIVNTRFSTGLLTGGIVTVNAGDNTKIDISDGTGIYVDNTTTIDPIVRLKVSWTGLTAIALLPALGTEPLTFVGLDLSSGGPITATDVVLQPGEFGPEQRRVIVTLAGVVHLGMVQIENIGSDYSFILDGQQTMVDLARAILSVNIDKGNVYGPNSADDLTIDKSAGSTFNINKNYQISKTSPNITTDLAQSPVPSFFYTYRDGLGGGFITTAFTDLIDPTKWDNNGVLVSLDMGNTHTIQRIWHFPQAGNIAAIHYGQNQYSNFADALAAINTELFSENPILITGFRAWLIVGTGTTNLVTAVAADDARFIPAGMFGDILRS